MVGEQQEPIWFEGDFVPSAVVEDATYNNQNPSDTEDDTSDEQIKDDVYDESGVEL